MKKFRDLKLIKNEKAMIISGPFIVLCIIVCMVSAYLFVINRQIVMQDEVKGEIDIAAVGALSYATNMVEIWNENFVIDTSTAENKFIQLMDDIVANGSSVINGYEIVDFRIYAPNEMSETTGIYDRGRRDGRQQYVLEAIVRAEYPTMAQFDNESTPRTVIKDFINGGRNRVYQERKVAGNGMKKVIVHTIARTTLR